MAENNQDMTPEVRNSSSDELNNLSDSEKAAFEKIMAEIGVSFGDQPQSNTEDLNAPDNENTETDSNAPDNAPDDDENPPAAEKETSEEQLSAEQQAALERILAEINGESPPESDIAVDTVREDNADSPSADSGEAVENTGADEPDDTATPTVNEEITLEEFGDALEDLLASSRIAVEQSKPSVKPEPSVKKSGNDTPQTDESDLVSDATTETSLKIESEKLTTAAKPAPPVSPPADSMPHGDAAVAAQPSPAAQDTPAQPKRLQAKNNTPKRSFRLSLALTLFAAVIIAAAGIYFGFTGYQSRFTLAAAKVGGRPAAPNNAGTTVDQAALPALGKDIAVQDESLVKRSAVSRPLEALQARIADNRKKIQDKNSEIQQLVQYYETGINAELAAIEKQLSADDAPELNAPSTGERFELELKSIQRRRLYQSKLDRPLQQLARFSEELLFHDRIVGLYQLLNGNLVSLPLAELQNKVEAATADYKEYIEHLTIDDIEAAAPSLESLWQQIRAEFKTKQERSALLSPLNRSIGEEVCRGDLKRVGQLTALSDETARCLSQCTAKDLYLNGLSELTPEIARILAQWPGESLVLNGLGTLSAEAARQIALWPGKRLSLNGLAGLSPEATRHLSNWNGSHLEMIGLQSIGPWQNYNTRLYLSEKLRRQLEQ